MDELKANPFSNTTWTPEAIKDPHISARRQPWQLELLTFDLPFYFVVVGVILAQLLILTHTSRPILIRLFGRLYFTIGRSKRDKQALGSRSDWFKDPEAIRVATHTSRTVAYSGQQENERYQFHTEDYLELFKLLVFLNDKAPG